MTRRCMGLFICLGIHDVPAEVPGGVYTDLLRLGYLDDPYYRYDDDTERWVGRTDWLYSKNFTG